MALSAALLAPGLAAPYHDGAIFAVVGEQWTHGSWPYADIWDHKPPAVYMVTAAGSLLPGPPWPWLWLATVGALAGAGLALRTVVGTPRALVSVLSMGLWPVALGGGQTESFAALFGALAVVAASRGRWVTVGALASVGVGFSLQLVASAPFFLVLGYRKFPQMAIGVVMATALILLPFALAGALPDLVDALFTYSSAYLASDRVADMATVSWFVPSLLPFAAILFRRRPLERIDVGAAAWLILGAVLIALQGRLLSHYIIPLAVPLAILLDLRGQATRLVAACGCAVALVTASVMHQVAPHRSPASDDVGRSVQMLTDEDDPILVWGTEAWVYLAADRVPAGRYPYLMPLVTPGYTTPDMIQEWVDDLDRNPPAVIVDAEAANSHWPDGEDFLRPPPPGAAGGRTLDLLNPFREWVRENYAKVGEVRGRAIYRLRGATSGDDPSNAGA